jgi:hypothetical protein
VLFLLGTEMDFKVDKLSSTFVFNNPNQTSACGCGESVQLTPAADPAPPKRTERGRVDPRSDCSTNDGPRMDARVIATFWEFGPVRCAACSAARASSSTADDRARLRDVIFLRPTAKRFPPSSAKDSAFTYPTKKGVHTLTSYWAHAGSPL